MQRLPLLAALALLGTAGVASEHAGGAVAPFDRPLWFGFFYAYSDLHPPDNPTLPQNVTVVVGEPEAIARAAAHVPVIVGGSMRELEAASYVWDRVAAVFVENESSVDALEDDARDARQRLVDLDLADRPIVAYVTERQVEAASWRMPAGVDWLAPEIYVDPALQDDAAGVRDAALATAALWRRRTPSTVPWLIVGQAYDRNGLWQHRETLASLQLAYAEIARHEPRVRGILLFAANRPGGVRDHPSLAAVHGRLFDAIPGAPAIGPPAAVAIRPQPPGVTITRYDDVIATGERWVLEIVDRHNPGQRVIVEKTAEDSIHVTWENSAGVDRSGATRTVRVE